MKHPTITIGKASEGPAVELDGLRLVDTRLLIQANSGGGKSWLLRRIAEQVAGETGEEEAVEAVPDQSTRNVLREVIAAGETLTRDSLAERLGLHPNGGRYGRSLAWLRTMGLIAEKGDIKPTPALFA